MKKRKEEKDDKAEIFLKKKSACALAATRAHYYHRYLYYLYDTFNSADLRAEGKHGLPAEEKLYAIGQLLGHDRIL